MIDQFLWFCLPEKDKQWISQFRSPSTESSVFKWIPVAEKPRAREICAKLGLRTRVVYRGPREPFASYTRPQAATHITLYPIG